MFSNSQLESELRAEVEAVHDFIAVWFRGDVEANQATFDKKLRNHFAPDFLNIQPSGRRLSRDELFDSMFDGHGLNPAFRINIRCFELVSFSEGGDLATATYIEDQEGAKNSIPPGNSRISTVVFQIGPGPRAFEWIHLHETGLN